MNLTARRKAFRTLHERGCFVIPNPRLAAWTGFVRAAQTLRSKGSFAGLASLIPYAEMNGLFETSVAAHQAIDDQCGRSESLDSDDVGDIVDEGVGHRG